MKRIIILLLLVSPPLFSSGQSGEFEKLSLGVEKVSDYEKVTYVFKEGKTLRITTRDGSKIYSNHYNIYEEFIVFNLVDTVLLEDIQTIKGKVNGNKERKIIGIIITGYGIAGGTLGTIVIQAFQGGSAWMKMAIPFSVMTIGGIKLLGARKFKSHRWRVVVLPVNEKEIIESTFLE